MWHQLQSIGGLRFMTRISEVFKDNKAFIPFITAGDPDLETTEKLVHTMTKAGADLIELGIPFSDPVAEGPVIQEASYRSLSANTTIDKIFKMVEKVRISNKIPLAFMTYINPIYNYGSERFMKACNRLEVDALIVADLPFEEKKELKAVSDQYQITLISMITPTSKKRIPMIVKEAEGFIYCVSSMGVTGVRSEISCEIGNLIRDIKEVKDIPCAIGFGISTPTQAQKLAAQSDGIIVGSAVVEIIAQHGRNSIPYVEAYVRKIKDGMGQRDGSLVP